MYKPCIAENNELFFQSSLDTRFSLPAAGQSTSGVFRISLVAPQTVETL